MNENKNDIPTPFFDREFFELTKIAIFLIFFTYEDFLISIYKNMIPKSMVSFD